MKDGAYVTQTLQVKAFQGRRNQLTSGGEWVSKASVEFAFQVDVGRLRGRFWCNFGFEKERNTTRRMGLLGGILAMLARGKLVKTAVNYNSF